MNKDAISTKGRSIRLNRTSKNISSALERVPPLFLAIQGFRYRNTNFKKRLVTPKHDLMIEGFPRSSNSFAVQALLAANGGKDSLRIATHTHSSAHVAMAVHYKVPAMVIIRKPKAAIVSTIALNSQSGRVQIKSKNDVRLLLQDAGQRYVRFYEQIEKLRDSILLFPFEAVITDFGNVTKEFNARFNTDFRCFNHTDKDTKVLFENSKLHLAPNTDRDRVKLQVQEDYMSPNLSDTRFAVEDVYARVTASFTKNRVAEPQ